MCSLMWFCATVILLFIIYKLIDWLLRLPTVGRHADRCVLITGCSSGFGRDLARRLDSLGCHVFATCRKEQDAVELSNVCSSRLRTIIMDVTQPESVKKAFYAVKDELEKDGKVLWAAVNNAGVSSAIGPPDWLTIDDYREVADVNLYGLIDVTMTFLPLVKKSRGRVVNMSSMGGLVTLAEVVPYSISKYGVEAFSDGLRRSLRRYGCKVSLIEPSGYDTKILSAEQTKSRIDQAWSHATPAVKTEYGEEYMKSFTRDCVGNMHKWASKRVSDVTDAYEHAVLGLYPRARYLVGIDARVLSLTTLLPEWLVDKLFYLMSTEKCPPAALAYIQTN